MVAVSNILRRLKMEDEWKSFGRETEAGRLLFSLYRGKQAPNISYPPVKTKPREITPAEPKPCPQRAHVQVPSFGKQPTITRKFSHGRKKPLEAILQEYDQQPERPVLVPGVDRAAEKDRLAVTFQYSNGALPKAVQLPAVPPPQPKEKSRSNASTDRPNPASSERPLAEEAEELFNSIVREIEERQEFLQQMYDLGRGADFEPRIKREIAERISDLQRLREIETR